MWNRRDSLIHLATAAAIGVPAIGRGDTTGGAASINSRLTGNLTPVHDPCMIREKGVYHLFSTSQVAEGFGLIHWRTSPDMLTWTLKGAVFKDMPAWAAEKVKGTRGIWAPDITFVNGQFRLYYSVSTFGSNQSAIGLATTATLDVSDPAFGWKDEGLVYESSKFDKFNAIDPSLFTDSDGRQYMAFGSFWSGIKLIEIDPATGKPLDAKPAPKALASRNFPGAIEGPGLIRRGGFYYLFASYDFCCRGKDSTYYTAVGRAETVAGPYKDYKGRAMMNEGGLLVLHTQLDPEKRFAGPGGASVFQDGDSFFIVYHAYDVKNNGAPTLRIARLAWTPDGWPVAV
jgi:arabinan endo-1,5-alpha-L-arabinosidase